MIRAGYRSSTMSTLEKAPEIMERASAVSTSGHPRGHGRRAPNGGWPSTLWERLRHSISASCSSAPLQREQLVSGAIALVHGTTCYYFLAARGPRPRGAPGRRQRRGPRNHTDGCRAPGASYVGLGGGRTASAAPIRCLRSRAASAASSGRSPLACSPTIGGSSRRSSRPLNAVTRQSARRRSSFGIDARQGFRTVA